jgi:hypothetical protein
MNSTLLLSNKYKKVGWFILIPAFILGVYTIYTGAEPSWLNAKVLSIFPNQLFGKKTYFTLIEVNLANTIVGVLFIVGALLVSFSKEKNEDEFISKLRLSCLLWVVLINYLLLLVAFILIYDIGFLNVMIYNMFTVLLIFIIRFNYILYKNEQFATNEK